MKILLIVGAIASGVSLLAETVSLATPPLTDDQELADNPFGVAIVLAIALLALLEFIIYVTTAIFFLMWLHRANSNLRAFNPWVRLEHSAGWAVGSFFIPFANLFLPYRAVREVWQKSVTPEEAVMSSSSPPSSFPAWWTFWLLSSFAGNISMRLSFNENVSESTATIVSILANVLSIPAAFFAYLVVDAIDKRQEEVSGKVRLGQFSGPPPPPPNLSAAVPAPVSE